MACTALEPYAKVCIGELSRRGAPPTSVWPCPAWRVFDGSISCNSRSCSSKSQKLGTVQRLCRRGWCGLRLMPPPTVWCSFFAFAGKFFLVRAEVGGGHVRTHDHSMTHSRVFRGWRYAIIGKSSSFGRCYQGLVRMMPPPALGSMPPHALQHFLGDTPTHTVSFLERCPMADALGKPEAQGQRRGMAGSRNGGPRPGIRLRGRGAARGAHKREPAGGKAVGR